MSPKFKSKFEADIYAAVLQNGFSVEYETLKLPYQTTSNYLPDFILPNGIIVEAKGYFDTRAQVKMRQVKKANPLLDIRFVFMNSSNRMNKRSKTTYAMWAEKYGFPYAECHIPLSWFHERSDAAHKEKRIG